jgi:hypothetical protein
MNTLLLSVVLVIVKGAMASPFEEPRRDDKSEWSGDLYEGMVKRMDEIGFAFMGANMKVFSTKEGLRSARMFAKMATEGGYREIEERLKHENDSRKAIAVAFFLKQGRTKRGLEVFEHFRLDVVADKERFRDAKPERNMVFQYIDPAKAKEEYLEFRKANH